MSLFKKAVPWLLLPLVAAALGACSSAKPKFQEDELFSSTASPYSRNFDFPATDACEAARRGLLSQGYMTTTTHTDAVDATKNFQPATDTHVVVEVHVVCTAGDASNTSVVYVNAVQNGYALKKSDTSASVGLSIFGSLSVPIRTNNDAMVKISSETIQSGSFYDKFFDLVGRYLRTSARSEPVPRGSIEITPLPPPASPSPPIAVVTPPAPAAALASRTVAPVIGDASAATASAAASAVSAAVAQAVANHPQLAAPATAARAATVETTASIQPTMTDGTHTMMATLPGIGEPPILAGPSGYEAGATRASGSAVGTGAAHTPAAGTSAAVTPALQAQAGAPRTSAGQDSAAQTPAAPASAAQGAASQSAAAERPAAPTPASQTSATHTATAQATNSPAATAATATPASGAASSTPVAAAPTANPATATAQ